jgi:hypothetical protein
MLLLGLKFAEYEEPSGDATAIVGDSTPVGTEASDAIEVAAVDVESAVDCPVAVAD